MKTNHVIEKERNNVYILKLYKYVANIFTLEARLQIPFTHASLRYIFQELTLVDLCLYGTIHYYFSNATQRNAKNTRVNGMWQRYFFTEQKLCLIISS